MNYNLPSDPSPQLDHDELATEKNQNKIMKQIFEVITKLSPILWRTTPLFSITKFSRIKGATPK